MLRVIPHSTAIQLIAEEHKRGFIRIVIENMLGIGVHPGNI